MLLGVLSDTHLHSGTGSLHPGIASAFEGVELILHAGDIVALSVLEDLRRIAPVEAVAGNMDLPEVKRALPEAKIIEIGGHRIGLTHGAGAVSSISSRVKGLFEGVSVIVFGHSHSPLVSREDGILLMNPGSAGDGRGGAGGTVGRLHVGKEVRGEILSLEDWSPGRP